MTYDRLRHDALHLGGHGACCREASGTGRSAGCGLLRARESGFGKAPPVARRAAGAGHAWQSHTESPRAVEWRSRLARRVLRRHRSCTRRKRSGRLVTSYGHSVIRARVCKNFAIPNAQSVQAQTDSPKPSSLIASRAPARATRRRPAHRASSLGRHGRFTELRQTCRRRRPRLGTSPLVSRASLSARTSAAAAAWISRERAWPFDTLA